MLPDEQPVECILEGLDAEMAFTAQPKVILFDIGGVVVSALTCNAHFEVSFLNALGWVSPMFMFMV